MKRIEYYLDPILTRLEKFGMKGRRAALVAILTSPPACTIEWTIWAEQEGSSSTGIDPKDKEEDKGTDSGETGQTPTESLQSTGKYESEGTEGVSGGAEGGTAETPEGCGDEIFNPEIEACDLVAGQVIATEGTNCKSETGFYDGILKCNLETCQFDLSECTGICGDGFVTPGETCDDCNEENNDGCDENCQHEACGNGILDPMETCDDGNNTETDGCTSNCILSTCGNGKLDEGEMCDHGETEGYLCQPNCKLPASDCVVG